MINLVVFDFDGVLVDSETIGSTVWTQVFARYGVNIDPQTFILNHSGKTGSLIVRLIEEEFKCKLPDTFLEEVNIATEKVLFENLQVIAGVEETLSQIKVPVCIASGSRPSRIDMCLDKTGLRKFFPPETVFSSHYVKEGKPAPDIFYYAAEKMNINPTECLVVEDSSSGIIGAKIAGMKTAGFLGGSHVTEERTQTLLKAGVDSVFSDFKELLSLL